MSSQQSYFVFHFLYAIASVILFIQPVIVPHFKIAFQSALLAFTFYPTGLMRTLKPDDNGRVQRTARVGFCVAAFISLVLVCIASINPTIILFSECDTISDDSSVVDICLHEKGFIIYYLIYMSLLFLLHFVALLWYSFKVKDA